MSKKRTIDSFFGSQTKKPRASTQSSAQLVRLVPSLVYTPSFSNDNPIESALKACHLPLSDTRTSGCHSRDSLWPLPPKPGKAIDDQPDLDIVYFEPYIPRVTARNCSSSYVRSSRFIVWNTRLSAAG